MAHIGSAGIHTGNFTFLCGKMSGLCHLIFFSEDVLSENPVVNQGIEVFVIVSFSVGDGQMDSGDSLFRLGKSSDDFRRGELGRTGFIKDFNGII